LHPHPWRACRYFSNPFQPFLPPIRNAVVIFSCYLAAEWFYKRTFPEVPALKVEPEVEFPKNGGAFQPKA